MSSQATTVTLSFSSLLFLHQAQMQKIHFPFILCLLDRCSFFLVSFSFVSFSCPHSLARSLALFYRPFVASAAVVKTQATVSATGSAPSQPRCFVVVAVSLWLDGWMNAHICI